MNTKRFSLRFNLDREDDRRAWEALHRMERLSLRLHLIAIAFNQRRCHSLSRRAFSNADERKASDGCVHPAAECCTHQQHRVTTL